MRITAVTAQKHNPERVNLYIDGEFRCGLCIQTAADFGLAPGRELSPRELNDIAAADAYPAVFLLLTLLFFLLLLQLLPE